MSETTIVAELQQLYLDRAEKERLEAFVRKISEQICPFAWCESKNEWEKLMLQTIKELIDAARGSK